MFSRDLLGRLTPILVVAICGGAIAWTRMASKPQPTAVAAVNVEESKNETHSNRFPVDPMPLIGWKPGEPWPGKWIQYPADDVLPQGLSIEVANGYIAAVSAPVGAPSYSHLIGTSYVIGDLDETDITEPLWRGMKLTMPKPDGSVAKLGISRPLWWIEETGAKVGATIDIGLHEVGISGLATVHSMEPCKRDSRDTPPNAQVVTGKIEHENAIVLDLMFENDDHEEPLGVTANHPLYSADRDDWVPAGDLKINERVRTLIGPARLLSKTERPGRHKVYNIEVHRSHAYYVTQFGILAHNSNILNCTQTPVFRGGDSLQLRDIDVKIEPATGLVKPRFGLSVSTVEEGLERFGGARRIQSIPPELQIIQQGQNVNHFVISPIEPMTRERFQELLNLVVLE